MSQLLDPNWNRAAILPYARHKQTGEGSLAVPGVLADLLSAVMLPGDVYQGNVLLNDPETGRTSDQVIRRSADLAGSMSVGAPAVTGAARMAAGKRAIEPNVVNIFAGPTAKTADKAALKMAQGMAEKGATREEIWNATGWFKGADGKWKFEIDDSAAQLRQPAKKALEDANVGEKPYWHGADGVMQHEDLFAAYPDLWKIDTHLEKGGGYPYQPSAKHIIRESGKEEIHINAANPHQAVKLGLHELQHPIQAHEGFARGADALNESLAPYRDEIMAKAIEDSKNGIPLGDAMARREAEKRWEIYMRSAGEVEARNVEARRNMNAAQRRATPPWATQDYPDDQQIVRFR